MLQYVWLVVATGVCYCNHLRIVLQLVGIIAMAFLSCNSIGFCCNYLVLLQLHWIWLLLFVTIAMVVLVAIIFSGVAIARWLLQQEFLMDAISCSYCNGFLGL